MKNNIYTAKAFRENLQQEKYMDNPVVTKDFQISSFDDNTSKFIITTDAQDRVADIVNPDGLMITNYLNNPVVLENHKSDEFPIAKCTELKRVGNGWEATIEYVDGDIPLAGPRAEAVKQLVKQGFLNAVSIGFRPLEFEFNDEGGINYLQTELTEFSIVTIPCNQEALVVERSLNKQEEQDTSEEDSEEEIPDPESKEDEQVQENSVSEKQLKLNINRKRKLSIY